MCDTPTNLSSDISVVMITRNRMRSLARALQELQQLPEQFPIIVVDNQSTDGTVAMIAHDFPDVQVVALDTNMGALGRNIGVEHAQTPYIAFCDDDSWWEPGALSRAIHYLEHYPDVGLIAGKILIRDERRLEPTSALQSISPLTPMVAMPGPAILGFLGCGNIVRKEAFVQVGGYNDHIYFSGEEELLGIDMAAAGWGLTYCQDIVGRHYPSKSRNMPRRDRMSARNVIQAAWMRRSWRHALTRTTRMIGYAASRPDKALGIVQGLLRLPVALRHRRVVPQWLEDQISQLEEQNESLRREAAARERQHNHDIQVGAAPINS